MRGAAMPEVAEPKPGTDAALSAGCLCPVIDNHFGRGRYGAGAVYGWLLHPSCPLHGGEPPRLRLVPRPLAKCPPDNDNGDAA